MEWFEEKEISEMPKYLNVTKRNNFSDEVKFVHKCESCSKLSTEIFQHVYTLASANDKATG